jgi:hypothetical protein
MTRGSRRPPATPHPSLEAGDLASPARGDRLLSRLCGRGCGAIGCPAGKRDHSRKPELNVSSRFDVAGFGTIVTGGASGLGLAYGEVLAAHEARVTLIDVDAVAVAAQASRLREQGFDVQGAVADVTDHAALDRVIDAAAERSSATPTSAGIA